MKRMLDLLILGGLINFGSVSLILNLVDNPPSTKIEFSALGSGKGASKLDRDSRLYRESFDSKTECDIAIIQSVPFRWEKGCPTRK